MFIRRTAVAVALSATFALAGCSSGSSVSTGSTGSSSAATSTDDSMAGMDHSSAEHPADVNDEDTMFASMMIVHHEQAIEMSDIVLAKDGVNAEVVTLAEQIKAAQGPEIATLQGWLTSWGVTNEHENMDGMDHGDGMMSEDDLKNLAAADGPTASRMFLEQMIVHHEGAITMAQTEVDKGKNPDAKALAQQIIDAQTAEIQTMKDLLTKM